MNNHKFRKILDAILLPFLAILSGLVVMGILDPHFKETTV